MKNEIIRDNYKISTEQAREQFLKEDADALIRKFRLQPDPEYLVLHFLDRTLRIERASGKIAQKSTGAPDGAYTADDSFYTALSVFDYLCCSRVDRHLSGHWVSTQKLGLVGLTKDEMFMSKALYFDTRTEALRAACEKLGGFAKSPGDVSYVLQTFDELPVWFRFWRGDEEFSPKISLLWDGNSLQYVHFETLYYIAPMVLSRIKEVMNEESN